MAKLLLTQKASKKISGASPYYVDNFGYAPLIPEVRDSVVFPALEILGEKVTVKRNKNGGQDF